MTPEQKVLKRVVEESVKPLREEIKQLRMEVEILRGIVSSLSNGFQPLR